MTLQQWCRYLGWNQAELARQARIDEKRTARKALEGEPISPGVARAIAQAITEALHNGTVVHPGDIEGLNIKD